MRLRFPWPAYGLVCGSSRRKFKSPKKKRCDVEYSVVGAPEEESGRGENSRDPTI